MKKIILVLVGCSILANSYAEPVQVRSANICCNMRIDLPKDDLTLFSTSLINERNTIDVLFQDLPEGTKIYMWQVADQTYRIFMKTDLGWGLGGTNTVENGQGLFIRLPAGVQTNLVITGDVPLDASKNVFSSAGYALLSYPYPHDVLFINTEMAQKAAVGDQISFWKNGWTTYTKTASGWLGAEELKLKMGQAFFYRSSQNTTYTEPRPFGLQD
jgi:hypothetical protein